MVQLPKNAAQARAAQKAALAGVIHERSVDPEIGRLLDTLETSDLSSLDEFALANIRETRRDYKKSTAVTEDLHWNPKGICNG
ncbi:Thermostable carboxypeptidase 1 [Picochlorum sp. SENEW3]|nr:Thermostable carboxypeptidase 1 [Picochlorum sp. SENEW3]